MKTLEVVALTNDVPEKHLRRGQVGTVVEMLVGTQGPTVAGTPLNRTLPGVVPK